MCTQRRGKAANFYDIGLRLGLSGHSGHSKALSKATGEMSLSPPVIKITLDPCIIVLLMELVLPQLESNEGKGGEKSSSGKEDGIVQATLN